MPIVTQEDADKIFACLKDLEFHYGEAVVSDNLELNVYGNIDASMLVSGVRIEFLVS